MNRPVPGAQMRAGFPPQPSSTIRNAGTSQPGGLVNRLPTNKLATGWSFPPQSQQSQQGLPPPLQQQQQQQQQQVQQHQLQQNQHQQQLQMQGGNMASFAQTMGGMSQPATPLDLSEFPALGGGAAQQAQAQAWARTNTQSPGANQGRSGPQDNNLNNHLNVSDDFDLQRSNQGVISSQQATMQAQQQQQPPQGRPRPGSLEDFPALPSIGAGDVIGGERKGSFLIQNHGLQNGSHLDMLSHQQSHEQSRNMFMGGLSSGQLGQQSQIRQQHQQQQQNQIQQQVIGSGSDSGSNRGTITSNLSVQNGGIQGSRLSPLDQSNQRQGASDDGKKSKTQSIQQNTTSEARTSNLHQALKQGQNGTSQYAGSSSNVNAANGSNNGIFSQPPRQQTGSQPQYSSTTPSEDLDNNSLSGQNEVDKFGLGGLLPLIRNENVDMAMFGLGTDLNQMGLELDQPEYGSIFLKNSRRDLSIEPLHTTFASPWSEAKVQPVPPEFKLPTCYSVRNTQPLDKKLANFSEETLFFIFYTMPRDLMQDIAAHELTTRGWRYHKDVQLWLTKLTPMDPTMVSSKFEKNTYIFFEPNLWERTQVSEEELPSYIASRRTKLM